jgi:hypothetical protein
MGVPDAISLLEEHEAATKGSLSHELLFDVDGEHLQNNPALTELPEPEVTEGVSHTPLPLVEATNEEVVVAVSRGKWHG